MGQTNESPATRVDIRLDLYASNDELWALSQFIKRTTWEQIRANAVDEAEAYTIRDGIDILGEALRSRGYNPR